MSDSDLLICPFDSNHKVKASKMHTHLMRCRRSHPELDKILETCSFNAMHRYHPEEREKHYEECAERRKILQSQQLREEFKTADVSVPHYTRNVQPAANYDEDDWDEEPVVNVNKPNKTQIQDANQFQFESGRVPHDRKRGSYDQKPKENDQTESLNTKLNNQKRSQEDANNTDLNNIQNTSEVIEIKTSNIKQSASSYSINNVNEDTKNEENANKIINEGAANFVPKKVCIGRGILSNRK